MPLPGIVTVLRHRDFRLLWSSQAASLFGDALILVAVGLYVTRLTGHPSDVGLVLASYTVPLVLVILFGGVVADRLPRQQVMIAADVARGVLHGTLAVLIAIGVVRIWQMVVIGVLYGCAEAFFRPAYTGLVPQTVPERDIQQAQALGGMTTELATFVSPALATALVLGVGGAAAFAADALTFLVSVVLLLRVGARQRGVPAERSTVLAELREGWSAVRARPWVGATIAVFAGGLMLAEAPFFVVGPAVSRDLYGTAAVYGLSEAAWGLGTVSGAVAGSLWRPRRPILLGMAVCVPWPFAVIAFALAPPVPVVYLACTAAGVGMGLFTVWWETALAERIPPHLLSRVSAWDWMGSLALLPAGFLLTGPVADAIGARTTLLVGGVTGVVVLTLGLLPRSTRGLVRLPGPGEAPVIAADALLPGARPG